MFGDRPINQALEKPEIFAKKSLRRLQCQIDLYAVVYYKMVSCLNADTYELLFRILQEEEHQYYQWPVRIRT